MAKNTVTLIFAGDSKKLEKSFKSIDAAANKMQRSVKSELAKVQGSYVAVGAGIGKLGKSAASAAGVVGAGFSRIGRSAGSMASAVGSGIVRIGVGFKDLAVKAGIASAAIVAIGAVAGVKLAKALLGTSEAASDLNEAVNKSDAVFGSAAGAMREWAATASTAVGLSQAAALDAAGGFGNMFQQLGFGSDVAADMSKKMVIMAADFASFHNADITNILQAQSAAFRGEYDALQRFLPLMSAATIEQKAMAQTGKENKDELTAQDKALASYSLMVEGAGAATGDFTRTSGEYANALRISKARLEDLRAEIGEKMLPVSQKLNESKTNLAVVLAGKVSEALDKVGAWYQDNRERVDGLVQAVKNGLMPIMATLSGFMGGEMSSVLGGVVVPALLGLGDAFVANQDRIHDLVKIFISDVLPVISVVAQLFGGVLRAAIIDVLVPAIEILGGWFIENRGLVEELVGVFTGSLLPTMDQVSGFIGGVFTWVLSGLLLPALKFLAELIVDNEDKIRRFGQVITGDVLPGIQSVAEIVGGALVDAFETKLVPAVEGAVSWLQDNREAFQDIANVINEEVISRIEDFVELIGTKLFDAVGWIEDHKKTWEALADVLGGAALTALNAIGDAFDWFKQNEDLVDAVILAIGVYLANALIGVGIAAGIAAFNMLLMALPIILIGALVVGLAYLIITNWDWIKEKTEVVFEAIKERLNKIWEVIGDDVKAAWEIISTTLSVVFEGFVIILGLLWEALKFILNLLWEGVKLVFKGIGMVLDAFLDGLLLFYEGVSIVIGWVIEAFKLIGQGLAMVFEGAGIIIGGIIDLFQWLGDKIMDAVDWANRSIDSMLNKFDWLKFRTEIIFKAIGNFISKPIMAAVDAIRDAWNNTIGGKGLSVPAFDIPGGPSFGGSSVTIPKLATGGLIKARPGGIIANIAEGGQDEAVIPLDRLDRMMGNPTGGASQTIVVNVSGSVMSERELVSVVRDATRRGGRLG